MFFKKGDLVFVNETKQILTVSNYLPEKNQVEIAYVSPSDHMMNTSRGQLHFYNVVDVIHESHVTPIFKQN